MIPQARLSNGSVKASLPPISGFTVIRNARLMGYPILESLQSLLPLVDELVVGLGQSDDDTRSMIESLNSSKLKVFDAFWDTTKTKGGLILSEKTNEAMAACKHDWCFYLQADEVLHEADLPGIRDSLAIAAANSEVQGLLFDYVHFYGSYSTIATSRSWYRKEVRLIKKSSGIQSHNDAQGFRVPFQGRLEKPKVLPARARVFHYGWVKPPKMMGQKSLLLNRWWHGNKKDHEFQNFEYARQYGLREFSGTHPEVMRHLVASQDWFFNPQYRLLEWSPKDWNLFASDLFERVTGYRIGEYKPYRLVKL